MGSASSRLKTLHILGRIRFTSVALPWKRKRFLQRSPLLVAECRKTVKELWVAKSVSRKLTYNFWTPSTRIVNFLNILPMEFYLGRCSRQPTEIQSTSLSRFRVNRHFVSWGSSEGPLFFGTEMSVFTGRWHRIDKLLNTKYEENPTHRPRASETRVHRYGQTDK